jgi:hypothetical protein
MRKAKAVLGRAGMTAALLAAPLWHMAACGGPAKEGGPGAACFRADECQAGLVCVDRVCSNDLTTIDIHPEGGAGAVGAGGSVVDDGGAGGAQGGAGGAQGGAGGASGGAGGAAGSGGAATGGAGPGGSAPGGSGGSGPDDASVE